MRVAVTLKIKITPCADWIILEPQQHLWMRELQEPIMLVKNLETRISTIQYGDALSNSQIRVSVISSLVGSVSCFHIPKLLTFRKRILSRSLLVTNLPAELRHWLAWIYSRMTAVKKLSEPTASNNWSLWAAHLILLHCRILASLYWTSRSHRPGPSQSTCIA